jgi:mannose-6-phosphate isomerase-like protein (cupin superfamily)
MRMTMENAEAALRGVDEKFVGIFRHGSLEVEFYRPKKADLQTPHSRDEVYVVVSGRGEFFKDGNREPFEAGEVLFVPAGVEHRFEDFLRRFRDVGVLLWARGWGDGPVSRRGSSPGRLKRI